MRTKIVVQKADLDTALTALICGVTEGTEIVVVRDKAGDEDLANPQVICIECGGSGQTELNNFDHHNTDHPLPSACVQAFQKLGNPADASLQRLVEYVGLLDTQGPEQLKARSRLPKGAFPVLSDVFSGMVLINHDPKAQLLQGIAILRKVLEDKTDPFGLMPQLPQWCDYLEAKRKNDEAIQRAVQGAKRFETRSGLKAGFVETDVIGALGALYGLGYVVVVAYARRFGHPPVPKYTIAGNGVRVDSLLPALNEREPGWGGPAHGTIIGSPRAGTSLKPEDVVSIVKECL